MDIEAEKKREAAYWKERFNIMTAANARMSQQTYNEVAHAFDLAFKDIQRDIDVWMQRFAKNNGVTLAEARKMLNARELKELKWDVDEYIKHGRIYGINGKWAKELENASARVHISHLEALKIRAQNHLETAFAVENKAVDKLIKDVYRTDYYRTAFEFQKGTGIGFDIIGLDEKKLDIIAHKPWTVDRRTFSDRIWSNKDKMVNSLHQEFTRSCIYGRSRKDTVKELEQYVDKNIKNAKYCAARVVRTETAFISSQSQHDSLMNVGAEMYEIYLPTTNCPICQEMNGKRFKMSEFEVGATAPPFHPNCDNGTLIPIYNDDFFKDDPPESAEEIPDDLSYEEWEKKFVKPEKGLTTTVGSGTIKENVVNSSRVEMSQGSLIEQHQRHFAADVTDEYLRAATPAQGNITYDIGYNKSKHKDEIKMSDWLFKIFGGEIRLLNESNIKNQMMPDYLWNSKYWELKGAHSINGADKLLQRAIKQIQNNPGGVILNALTNIDMAALEEQLLRRIERSGIDKLDIMILANGELIKILRYKK